MMLWIFVLKNDQISPHKHSRWHSRPGWLIGLLFLMATVSIKSSECGYLPVIGPAPFRFAPVMAPATNHVTISAPIKPAIPATPPPPPTNAVAKVLAPAPPAPVPAKPPVTATVTPVITGASSPMEEPSPVDSVVSPQMLLKYFNNRTNSAPSVVTPVGAPIDFTPPRAPGPPPSTATFSTGP